MTVKIYFVSNTVLTSLVLWFTEGEFKKKNWLKNKQMNIKMNNEYHRKIKNE